MRHRTPTRAKADRAAMPVRRQFAEDNRRCWLCGSAWEMHLQTHEICSGPGRRRGYGDRRAMVRVCDAWVRGCHDIVQSWSGDDMAMQYALKQLRDPENYDLDWLNWARFVPNGGCSEADVRMATALVLEVVKW